MLKKLNFLKLWLFGNKQYYFIYIHSDNKVSSHDRKEILSLLTRLHHTIFKEFFKISLKQKGVIKFVTGLRYKKLYQVMAIIFE